MILVLFCLWEDASVLGSLKSLPLMFTFATWDQYPVFLHPEAPQAAQPSGAAAEADGSFVY